MSDFDDLDDLLGPLRSPATPAELASEQHVVDLMAANHSSKGTTMFTSRRARVATLIAAGIIGFGGVAAAGPAAYQLLEDSPADDQTEIEIETEDPVTEEVAEPEVEEPVEEVDQVDEEEQDLQDEEQEGEEEEQDVEQVEEEESEDPTLVAEEPTTADDPDTFFDEENDCKPGNHGKTVSAAAHGDADLATYEQRQVAQSSCGKMGDAVADDHDDETGTGTETETEVEIEETTEVEEKTEEVVEQPAAQSKGKSDQAPGKSKGKSGGDNGKGNNGKGNNGKKGG
jgi:hypothetical protein